MVTRKEGRKESGAELAPTLPDTIHCTAAAWHALLQPLGRGIRCPEREDVLQATALSLWLRIGDDPASEEAKRLRRVIFERRRLDAHRQVRRFPELHTEVVLAATPVMPEFAFEARLRREEALVRALGERGVELLLAIHGGARSSSELARQLKVDVKTIRRRRDRIRERLQAYQLELDGISTPDAPGQRDL